MFLAPWALLRHVFSHSVQKSREDYLASATLPSPSQLIDRNQPGMTILLGHY